MRPRPHLVIDGALLAADAVGAQRIVLYVGEEHVAARASITHAVAERAAADRSAGAPPIEVVAAPATYVAGEESAAVHYVNTGDARPTTVRLARSSAASRAGRPSCRTSRASRTPP